MQNGAQKSSLLDFYRIQKMIVFIFLQVQNLIALAGVYQPSKKIENSKVPIAVENYLINNPNIEHIVIHFDNDIAGRNATKALIIALNNRYNIYDIPAPYGKDINDYLRYILELKNRNKEV